MYAWWTQLFEVIPPSDADFNWFSSFCCVRRRLRHPHWQIQVMVFYVHSNRKHWNALQRLMTKQNLLYPGMR
jgi:hypothetical protein